MGREMNTGDRGESQHEEHQQKKARSAIAPTNGRCLARPRPRRSGMQIRKSMGPEAR